MSYVLVTADFPEVTSGQRERIYESLEKANWIKVKEFGRDISTVWYGDWRTTSENNAISSSIDEFNRCALPYCKPKLVLHYGSNKPTFYGLT